MGSENNFTLQAEGDPTTFTMTLKVLRREDGVMMKLTQYDVEEAKYDGYRSGSTNVVPEDAIDDNTDDREFNEKITYKKVKYGDTREEIVGYFIEPEDKIYYEVGDTVINKFVNEIDKTNLVLRKDFKIIQPYAYKIYINGKETDEFLLDDDGNILLTEESRLSYRRFADDRYDPDNDLYACDFTFEPIE